jgi:hypothetical protein
VVLAPSEISPLWPWLGGACSDPQALFAFFHNSSHLLSYTLVN